VFQNKVAYSTISLYVNQASQDFWW